MQRIIAVEIFAYHSRKGEDVDRSLEAAFHDIRVDLDFGPAFLVDGSEKKRVHGIQIITVVNGDFSDTERSVEDSHVGRGHIYVERPSYFEWAQAELERLEVGILEIKSKIVFRHFFLVID